MESGGWRFKILRVELIRSARTQSLSMNLGVHYATLKISFLFLKKTFDPIQKQNDSKTLKKCPLGAKCSLFLHFLAIFCVSLLLSCVITET